MSDNRKTFTFISRSAPYGCNRPQLCLDAALATAVFEQQVSYLFLGDGVYQLLKDQQGDAISSKTLSNGMETLDLYGVERVFVDEESLRQRKLDTEDLTLTVELLTGQQVKSLVRESDHVINL